MFVFSLSDFPGRRQTPSCPGRSLLLLPLPPPPMSGETLPKLLGEALWDLCVAWVIPTMLEHPPSGPNPSGFPENSC